MGLYGKFTEFNGMRQALFVKNLFLFVASLP
jgi:hypothetical protein